jgi:hypothetical protein
MPLNLCGIFVFVENTLLDELLGVRPRLEALLQAISPHMEVELPLVSLEGRRSRRLREDVALDEVVASGALVQALTEMVGCALALEFESFGLEGTGVASVREGQVRE